ncbi:PREDICTED: uncharacterized protein LOC109230372 [Nicotiana attenuata]|uniref:uncharacterized protein LOC109230372 n=1 Tax=Nicotiana attenuata TaxID=49451 RepID=UPI000905CD56|nr:PREDICTED: uncharacterized protein LOC109230372 [Nicotiana attenuata]
MDVVLNEHIFPFAKSSSLHPVNVLSIWSVSFDHEPLQGHAADHTLELLHTPAADHAPEEGNIVDVAVFEPQQAEHDEYTKNDPAPGQSLYVEYIEGDLYEEVYMKMPKDFRRQGETKSPMQSHWEAAIRVVRYIKLDPGMGILLSSKSGNSLTCFCDKSKKQQTMFRSSAGSEYRSLATTTAKVVWLLGLFTELGISIEQPVSVFSDSKAALQIATNPIFHERTSI